VKKFIQYFKKMKKSPYFVVISFPFSTGEMRNKSSENYSGGITAGHVSAGFYKRIYLERKTAFASRK